MYEKDGERYFILDGHAHLWDASPANWVEGQEENAKGWIECFHAYQGLGPAETHWSLEHFQKYSEDDLLPAVEAGALDLSIDDDVFEVLTEPGDLPAVRAALGTAVDQLRARSLQLQAEIAELRGKIDELESSAEETDDELAEAEEAHEEAESELADATRARDAAAAALERLQR